MSFPRSKLRRANTEEKISLPSSEGSLTLKHADLWASLSDFFLKGESLLRNVVIMTVAIYMEMFIFFFKFQALNMIIYPYFICKRSKIYMIFFIYWTIHVCVKNMYSIFSYIIDILMFMNFLFFGLYFLFSAMLSYAIYFYLQELYFILLHISLLVFLFYFGTIFSCILEIPTQSHL